MESKRNKPQNRQAIIYSGQGMNNLEVRVIQNTLPNYERSKYFVQTMTVDRKGLRKKRIVAKSNDIRKVNEVLSNLLGRKICLI